ncbi:MAG: hypothetical protein K5866_06480 [Treponema sp.]|nr:hypothetical protein [Treponema sp.]
MKKLITGLLSLLLALFVNSALFADNGIVNSLEGKVEVFRNNEWQALKVYDEIYPEELIASAFDSSINIKFGESSVTLGSLSRLIFEEYKINNGEEKVKVELLTGYLDANIQQTSSVLSEFVVKTSDFVTSAQIAEYRVTSYGKLTCNKGAVIAYSRSTYDFIQEKMGLNEEDYEEYVAEDSDDLLASDLEELISENKASNEIPKGAIVLSAKQECLIDANGNPTRPMDISKSKSKRAVSKLATRAQIESEIIGIPSGK